MPGMDGVALACRIKQYRPGVAVVIMKGHASMITRKISAVDEGIAKPLPMDELDETIRNLHEKVFRAYP